MSRQSRIGYLGALVIVAATVAATSSVPRAWAGEADDLQRMIDGSRQRAVDLERLDELKAAREDIATLRKWLEEAWALRAEQQYDDVRIVLDRCDAQADMIRERISASVLLAEAARQQGQVEKLRKEIAATRIALQKAQAQKAALQAKTK